MKLYKKLLALATLLLMVLVTNSLVFAKPPSKVGTAPSAPASLTYTGLTSTEVTLSWAGVSNATGYKLYRATPNDSNYSLLATISGTSYKNISLLASTKYWYYITAYNSYGTSAASAHISLTTNQTVVTQKKLVLGFTTYYYSGDSSSYNSMNANTSTIGEIATHTYLADSSGNISGLVPTSQVNYANSNNILAMAMVSNNFDGNIAKAILENPTNRQTLINNISSSLTANSYKGVNIDFEGVYYYDRSYLTTFMQELYNTLKPKGFTVTMSVPAKTYDSTTDGWSGAFDYTALANYSDQIVLMTYDEHYPGGTPGAIASIGWVENVIKYASSVVPKNKTLLGTAAYGYDWSSNGTKAYSISGINNLATTYSATIKWDSVSQSPYFNYTDSSGITHTVWFENAQSLNYKLDLVNSYNLSGIGIWRLGLENSDYWTSIKTKFNR